MKTYKRETAWGLLGLLAVIVFWAAADPHDLRNALVLYLAPPVIGFAALAFGLDWHSKQRG